jgi:serine/threonine-protein kinase
VGTPPSVRLLIQRCLERDRRQRVASGSTVLYALNDAALVEEQPTRVSSDSAAVRDVVDAAVADTHRTMMRRRVLPFAAATVVLAAAAALLWMRPVPAAPTIARLEMDFAGTATTPRGVLAISPDGQQVAYIARFRVFVRSLSEYGAREVYALADGMAGIGEPVFSRDSKSIAFFVGNAAGSSLWRVSLGGGAPAPLCNVEPLLGASWHETGIIVGQGPKGIVRCPANGGTVEQLVTVEAGQLAHRPQLLPDGKTLIYTLAQIADGRARWDKAQIVAETLGGGGRRTLINGGSDARYVATGHLLYVVGGIVFAVPFDLGRMEIAGDAVPVLEGVARTPTGLTGTSHFDTSNTGTLIYLPGPARLSTMGRVLAIATREGTMARLGAAPGPYEMVRVSPDGTRLLISSGDGAEGAVWIYPLDGKGPLQRLALQGRHTAAIWAPDGQRIAVQSDSANERAIFVVRNDSTGFERLTTPAAGEQHTPESWSPDGRYISFSAEREGRYVLRMVALGTKAVTPLAGIESDEPINSTFSPDGKWLAYSHGVRGASQTTTRGVYVQPFPPTGAVHQLPRQGLDFHPVWTRDGKEIVWVPSANSGLHAVVTMMAGPGPGFSAPVTFPARVTGRQTSGTFRGFDVLPDGRVVGVLDPSDADGVAADGSRSIHVVLNWMNELKQTAPAR